MTKLDELLATHGSTSLEHIGPDFDESKVKRDGGGKFAKKSEASGLLDGKDADWMKWDNLNGKLGDIAKAAGPAFSEAVRAVLDKYDLESRADLDNNPKAREEAAKAGVQILNNYAENRGVSPSGQGKIQYRIGNHGKIIAGVVTPKGYVVIPKRGAETSLRLSNSAPEVKAPAKAAASPPRTPPREPAKGTASPPRTPAKTTEGRPVTTTAEKILARKRKNRFKFDPNKARKEAKSLLDELLHEDDSESLEHVAVKDETTTGDGKKSRNKGNFDESKVKRDGFGQFAKKNSDLTPEELDKLWKQHLFEIKIEAAIEAKPLLKKAARDLLTKYGVPKDVPLNSKRAEKVYNENKAMQDEGARIFTDIMDNVLKETGVSPSGTQRLSYQLGPKGKMYSKIIPYNGPMPERSKPERMTRPNVKKAAANAVKSSPSSVTSDSGGFRFNPNAKLDTSRISDNDDPGQTLDIEEELEDWQQLLNHEDMVGEFLVHLELPQRTVQDVVNEMTPEQRDVLDIVVGAAVEDDDISEDLELVRQYNFLTDEQKDVIDFIVGAALALEIQHSEEVGEFLEHFGVKGMRWGIRKDDPTSTPRLSKSFLNNPEDRARAKARVKSGTGTLADAHLASLKSTGHRVTNAVLGDKTYWKQTAVITALAGAGIGLTFATAGLMPASALAFVGAHLGSGAAGSGAIFAAGGQPAMAALGSQIITGIGLTVTNTAASIASIRTLAANTGRAFRGNARIDKSFMELGKKVQADQNAGNKRVNKVLNESGSISKKLTVKHDDQDEVDIFLEHYGIKGMKWGIRRTDAQLGNGDGGTNGVKSKSGIDRLKSKLRRTKDDDDDTPKAKSSGSSDKKDDDGPDKPTVKGGSADHEAMMASLSKDVEGMSTRELQELNNRAQAMQNYQRLFAPSGGGDSKSPLEKQVAEMNLQKQYNQLKSELTPERRSMVSKLAEKAGQGYDMYGKIDKAVGGDLSKALSRKLGLTPPPNPQEQAKIRTEMAKAAKAEAEARQTLSSSAKKVMADDVARIELYKTHGYALHQMLPTGAKPGMTSWDGVDRSLDTDRWSTAGYKIENGVFKKNPSFGKQVPTVQDLISTTQKAPAYKPTHRAPTGLELLKSQLGTKRGGNNPGFPVIPPSRIGSKKHRRD